MLNRVTACTLAFLLPRIHTIFIVYSCRGQTTLILEFVQDIDGRMVPFLQYFFEFPKLECSVLDTILERLRFPMPRLHSPLEQAF